MLILGPLVSFKEAFQHVSPHCSFKLAPAQNSTSEDAMQVLKHGACFALLLRSILELHKSQLLQP